MGTTADRINAALASLKVMRRSLGVWTEPATDSETDPRDPSDVGILKSCEALEAFLIPFLGETSKGPSSSQRIESLGADILVADLQYILEKLRTNGWDPAPYLKTGEGTSRVDLVRGSKPGRLEFTDTVSFVVTTFLDALDYVALLAEANKPLLAQSERGAIIQKVREGLEWLEASQIRRGPPGRAGVTMWSWGRVSDQDWGGTPSVYFTYTAAIALWTALDSQFLSEVGFPRDRIISMLEGAYRWAISTVASSSSDSGEVRVQYSNRTDIDQVEPRALLAYVLLITEAASWGGRNPGVEVDREKLWTIAHSLQTAYRDEAPDTVSADNRYRIPVADDVTYSYPDRSIRFVALSGLCWAYAFLTEGKPRESKHLAQPSEAELKKLESDLIQFYADVEQTQDPATNCWVKFGFEIYLTQRAIEALTYYSQYFSQPLPSSLSPGTSIPQLEGAIKTAVNAWLAAHVNELRSSITDALVNLNRPDDPEGTPSVTRRQGGSSVPSQGRVIRS
jgi:hypothetical protein